MKAETKTAKTLRDIANLRGTVVIYNDGLLKVLYTTERSLLQKIRSMQRASVKEDFEKHDNMAEVAGFRILPPSELREYFDSFVLGTEAVIGFSIWNIDDYFEKPVLRQIYLKPAFRGYGLANVIIDAVLNFYHKYIAFEEWLVESPNNIMIKVLQKRPDFSKIKVIRGG